MPKLVDLTGKSFGKLIMLHRVVNDRHGKARWLCRCECGREKEFIGNNLGRSAMSCGQCPNRIEHFGASIVNWLDRPRTKQFSVPCFIDPVDYPLVRDYHWSVEEHKHTSYAMSKSSKERVTMHQLILPLADGFTPDHIDRDGLNNRRSNLRPATAIQNAQNHGKKPSRNYKGVHFKDGNFYARISFDNKRIYLGSFDLEVDAARAYNEAAKKYHGEFAELNELDDVSTLALDGVWINSPLRGQKVRQ